jgi:ribosomal protein L37E
MRRYQRLSDFITVTCNRCGSADVDLSSDECSQCGSEISSECNACHAKYEYHDFVFGDFPD